MGLARSFAQQGLSGTVVDESGSALPRVAVRLSNTPLFNAPLELSLGAREMHSECWALDFHVEAAFRRPIGHATR